MSKECSPKEKAVYQAVLELFWEGADLNRLTVSEITGKAGIGKGTAYEYFSDKEEMIARALLYNTRELCEEIYDYLKEEKDFYHKMQKLLLKMEEKITESICIFRLIHMVTDNSAINRKVQELAKEEAGMENRSIELLMRQIILEECKNGEKIAEEKLFYLVNSAISHIFCYGMILNDPYHQGEYKMKTMREMVCNSICREVQEMIL